MDTYEYLYSGNETFSRRSSGTSSQSFLNRHVVPDLANFLNRKVYQLEHSEYLKNASMQKFKLTSFGHWFRP